MQLSLVSSPQSPTSRCPTNKIPATGLLTSGRPGGGYQAGMSSMRIIYLLVTLSFFLFVCAVLQAAPIKNEGRGWLSVNGQILASACSIHTDDIRQEILFDALPHRTLRNNAELGEKKFSLRLTNCRLEKETRGEWKSFSVTFDGEIVSGNPSLFAVSGDARGVALRVMSTKGELAFPGLPMNNTPLSQEGHQLDYRLQVVADGEPFEKGYWSGSLRFMVAYQ